MRKIEKSVFWVNNLEIKTGSTAAKEEGTSLCCYISYEITLSTRIYGSFNISLGDIYLRLWPHT
jgi:hypothetical protein